MHGKLHRVSNMGSPILNVPSRLPTQLVEGFRPTVRCLKFRSRSAESQSSTKWRSPYMLVYCNCIGLCDKQKNEDIAQAVR